MSTAPGPAIESATTTIPVTAPAQQQNSARIDQEPTLPAMTQSPSSIAAAPAASAGPAAAATSASLTRQGSRFTIIGSAGTGLQLGLYAVLAAVIGAQIASAVSWLLSTLVTNRFHRALTFQVHEHEHSGSDQTVAFVTSLAGLGLTSIVLADLSDADGLAGLIAILAVNIAVGAGRFFGLRWWLGGSGRHLVDAVALTATNVRRYISARRISFHH